MVKYDAALLNASGCCCKPNECWFSI